MSQKKTIMQGRLDNFVRMQGFMTYNQFMDAVQTDIKGNLEKMKRAFEQAMDQSNKILSPYHFSLTDDLLIISKSVGTVVSGAWQRQNGLRAKNIYFTPVEATFDFINAESGIVFHGTKDPWVESNVVIENCNRLHLPLFLTEEANHSMEKGNAIVDLENMHRIMQCCQSYLMGQDI